VIQIDTESMADRSGKSELEEHSKGGAEGALGRWSPELMEICDRADWPIREVESAGNQ
jgi:hypothetical protein